MTKVDNISIDNAEKREPKAFYLPDWSVSFISGGVAGTFAKTAIAPLERVKILFQIRSVHYPYTGVIPTVRKIIENEGVIALWKGNVATVARIFPYAAIQFLSFEKYKLFIQDKVENRNLRNLIAGSMAGATSVMFTYPLDLVRVRLAVTVRSPQFGGISDCISTVVRNDGILGLFRGMSPTLMGIIPYAGVNFATYEFLKKYAQGGDENQPISIPARLLCGGLAGAVGQTVAYPLDVVRRQMQTAGFTEGHGFFHKNTVQALKNIVGRDGMKGLFTGLSINYIRVGPQVAISFTTYEAVKRFLSQYKQEG